jgi:hypothetical protein
MTSPTCPPDCFEMLDEIAGAPAVLFVRRSDGHCCGYRRPETGEPNPNRPVYDLDEPDHPDDLAHDARWDD